MEKVLGIVGSPRRYGNTDALLRLCMDEVKAAGLDTEIVYLHELNIKNCKGCLNCVFKGPCALEDDLNSLLEKMRSARGLIAAAPTYIFGPSAVIKTMIDRSLMITPCLEELRQQKRFAVTINVAGSPKWNPLGSPLLSQLALAYGYQILDGMEAYSPGPAEVILAGSNVAQARALGQKLASWLSGGAGTGNAACSGVRCPICQSSVYSLGEDGKVRCAACLNEGKLETAADGIKIRFDNGRKNFFDLAERQEHVDDWIKPSRDRYIEHRGRIKELLYSYNIRK